MTQLTNAIHQSELITEPPKKTGASNNRGNSKQDVGTPWGFIQAVVFRFGELGADLAATKANAKARMFIEPDVDSLKCPWYAFYKDELLWLNPPFGLITPWAEKCAKESALGARILMLTPASVDSNWWANNVHGKAWVEFLSPRIQFEGSDDPFPKPLALSCYNVCGVGYGCWRWKP